MFDKGKPIAGRKARYIDDDIRANNEAIEAAVGFGHDFATGSTQTGEHNDGAAKIYAGDTAPTTKEDGIRALNAGDVGKRLWLDTSVTPNVLKVLTAIGTPNTWTAIGHLAGDTVRLSESASDPAAVENIGFIYTKAANSKTELFMRLDAGGSVVQLTKNALLYLNNAKLDNDTYLKALNEAGNGDVDLIKASADDVPVLAAGAELAAAINDEAEDLAIPDKKYVDDQIAAETTANAPAMCKAWLRWTVSGTTYTIQDSYNVESLVRDAVGQLTVTFTTPFANANYAVAGTIELERHLINDMVRTPSTYKFRIRFGTDTLRDNDSSGSLIFMGTQ